MAKDFQQPKWRPPRRFPLRAEFDRTKNKYLEDLLTNRGFHGRTYLLTTDYGANYTIRVSDHRTEQVILILPERQAVQKAIAPLIIVTHLGLAVSDEPSEGSLLFRYQPNNYLIRDHITAIGGTYSKGDEFQAYPLGGMGYWHEFHNVSKDPIAIQVTRTRPISP